MKLKHFHTFFIKIFNRCFWERKKKVPFLCHSHFDAKAMKSNYNWWTKDIHDFNDDSLGFYYTWIWHELHQKLNIQIGKRLWIQFLNKHQRQLNWLSSHYCTSEKSTSTVGTDNCQLIIVQDKIETKPHTFQQNSTGTYIYIYIYIYKKINYFGLKKNNI